MIQGTEDSRFLLKTRQAIGIGSKDGRKDLIATMRSRRVSRARHFAHSACSERRLNLIGAKLGARGEGHCVGVIICLRKTLPADSMDCGRWLDSTEARKSRTHSLDCGRKYAEQAIRPRIRSAVLPAVEWFWLRKPRRFGRDLQWACRDKMRLRFVVTRTGFGCNEEPNSVKADLNLWLNLRIFDSRCFGQLQNN